MNLGELMLEGEEELDVVAVSRCFALHSYLPGNPNFLNDFIRTRRYGKVGKDSINYDFEIWYLFHEMGTVS